ncbi:acyl carrier protein, partial [Streptomyces lasiicapitis]|uniref:acyl carrier protein n=1 Tax=Streptomyces lasiicapitis TaxID=1923961 RepID=UPI0036B94437
MTDVAAGTVHRQIVDIVASRTLYDESYLLPESHFEADLGIDSVIFESIVAAVRERFALDAALPAGLATIGELAAAVEEALAAGGGGAPAVAGSAGHAPDSGAADPVQEAVVRA